MPDFVARPLKKISEKIKKYLDKKKEDQEKKKNKGNKVEESKAEDKTAERKSKTKSGAEKPHATIVDSPVINAEPKATKMNEINLEVNK